MDAMRMEVSEFGCGGGEVVGWVGAEIKDWSWVGRRSARAFLCRLVVGFGQTLAVGGGNGRLGSSLVMASGCATLSGRLESNCPEEVV